MWLEFRAKKTLKKKFFKVLLYIKKVYTFEP